MNKKILELLKTYHRYRKVKNKYEFLIDGEWKSYNSAVTWIAKGIYGND